MKLKLDYEIRDKILIPMIVFIILLSIIKKLIEYWTSI